MRIENTFQVPLARDEAWALLTDVSRVADCLPGATLTEAVDERTYRGELGVKLGPVSMTFLGEMRFTDMDPEAGHALELAGQAAQYGRGAGVLKKISAFMIGRFAQCLQKRLAAAEDTGA